MQVMTCQARSTIFICPGRLHRICPVSVPRMVESSCASQRQIPHRRRDGAVNSRRCIPGAQGCVRDLDLVLAEEDQRMPVTAPRLGC